MKSTGRPPRVIRFRCFAFDSLRRSRVPPPAARQPASPPAWPIFFIPRRFPPFPAPGLARPAFNPVQSAHYSFIGLTSTSAKNPVAKYPARAGRYPSPPIHSASIQPPPHPAPNRIFSTNFLPAPDFTRRTAIFRSLIPSRRALTLSHFHRTKDRARRDIRVSRCVRSPLTIKDVWILLSVRSNSGQEWVPRLFINLCPLSPDTAVRRNRERERERERWRGKKKYDRTRSWNLVRCFMNNLSKPSTAAISLLSSLF